MKTRRKTPARKPKASKRSSKAAQAHALRILNAIYQLARSDNLLDARAIDPTRAMLRHALRHRDMGLIYDWLIQALSLQGVSDRVAIGYARKNGSPTWHDLRSDLARKPSCPKLATFWHYESCGYSKTLRTCAQPDHIHSCPVPRLRLRNGRLNQLAWSLLLWIRDIADDDLVRWIRNRIRHARRTSRTTQEDRDGLLAPLKGIYGASDKVLSMALADLLLAAPSRWRNWRRLGGALIVIDTLVHNNLSRTGILARHGAEHVYGPGCYRPNGCAGVVDRVADRLAIAPRTLTHALWRYCSQDGLAICNGIRIDDSRPCNNKHCRLYRICDRRQLHVT